MDKSFAVVLQICIVLAATSAEEKEIDGNAVWKTVEKRYLNDDISHSFWGSSVLNGTRCHSDMEFVLKEAGKLNMWALKLLDSSAKLPSGILSGNLNQFGDFDECLSAKGKDSGRTIRGKYCLANVDVKARSKTDPAVRALDDVVHSHRLLTNELTDEGHRIPRIETFVWGLCVPSSCTETQVEKVFRHHLKGFSKESPFVLDVSITEELCYVDEKKPFTMIQLIVIASFAVVLLLTLLDLLVDLDRFETKHRKVALLKCFSLRKNWRSLMKTEADEDDIECLHGARFLNAIGLLLSHKQMAMLYTPMSNRAAMGEAFSRTWTMLGRSAILYTDSFIMFSGILASYSFVKNLDEKKTINFKQKLLNRFVRFTPNLLGIILFCTYLMDDLNVGPQWGLVVTKYANLCKKNMWRNFLYIHNYFGFEDMCLTHTHQLGIDMQLFFASPIFIYTLWKFPKLGTVFLALLSIVSTWLRYEVTIREELSTLIYYGISVNRLWKTANLSYILPTHRLTVYLMGIMVGYYLRRNGKKLRFNRWTAGLGWILSISAGLFAMFGPYQAAFKGYVYNPTESARYNAFAPVFWVAFITWGILACVNGYGGHFNKFLSWKYFRIFTKLSYAVYLTQFPVFFYNVGSERSIQYFKGFRSLIDIPELCVIVAASIVLTLTFDIPFQELKKVLTKPSNLAEDHKREVEGTSKPIDEARERVKGHRTRRKLHFHGT